MNFMLRLSIRYKIMAIALVGIAGFAGYLLYSLKAQSETRAELDNIEHVIFPIIERIDRSGLLLFKLRNKLATALSENDIEFISEAETSADELTAVLQEMASLDNGQRSSQISQLQRAFNNYRGPAIGLARGILDGSIDFSQLPDEAARVNQSYSDFSAELDRFREQGYSAFEQSIKQTNERNDQTGQVGIVIVAVVMLILIVSALSVASIITTTLNEIVHSTLR